MRKKIGFLKNAIAKANGYYSKSGEKLVSAKLTQSEMDEFNGSSAEKQAPVIVEEQPTSTKKSGGKGSGAKAVTEEVPATTAVVDQ